MKTEIKLTDELLDAFNRVVETAKHIGISDEELVVLLNELQSKSNLYLSAKKIGKNLKKIWVLMGVKEKINENIS